MLKGLCNCDNITFNNDQCDLCQLRDLEQLHIDNNDQVRLKITDDLNDNDLNKLVGQLY